MHSIVQAVARHAAGTPGKPALSIGGQTLTYAELWHGVKCAAAALEPHAGGILLLPAEKRAECIFYYLGAHLTGVANLMVDPKVSEEALAAVVGVLEPTCSLPLHTAAYRARHVLDWQVDTAEEAPERDFPREGAVADYMFTTGTTGKPKCVPLTQGNILASAANINAFIGNTAEDRELVALPLCHSFGMGRLRCQFLAGGSAVVIPNFANERKVVKMLQGEGVTGFAMVPAAWMYLKNLCEERLAEAGRGLRYIEFGSAALPMEEKRRLMELFPHTRLCMHYGLTEASRSAFIEFHAEHDRLDTVGKASPNTRIAVFGEDGSQLPPGEVGEVCVSGAHVTVGYLNVPHAECFHGPYFRTGDQGYMDADGYLHLSGRIKELINVGGKKVSPDEVDAVLARHPAVKECACVAAPDPDGILGEVVKAWIVPEEGVPRPADEELAAYLRRNLEAHKVPRIFCYREEPLPRTGSGKLQRGKLA